MRHHCLGILMEQMILSVHGYNCDIMVVACMGHTGLKSTCEHGQADQNERKNRNKDIIGYMPVGHCPSKDGTGKYLL